MIYDIFLNCCRRSSRKAFLVDWVRISTDYGNEEEEKKSGKKKIKRVKKIRKMLEKKNIL